MKRLKHCVIFLLLIHFMSAQEGVVPNDAVEAYITSLENEFNGSILIAINGDVRYQEHVGYVDFKQSALISSASRFNIGSIAKEFPAMALLYCVEEGLVQLRVPIGQYLSELPEWASEITVDQLLFYTSGLPPMTFHPRFDSDDVLRDLQKVQLVAVPGENYLYSNLNNFLQAKIVEEVSGMSLSTFVQTEFFVPLGMTSATYTFFPPSAIPNLTYSYSATWGDDIASNPNTKAFALNFGPVYLTPLDLWKWSNFVGSTFQRRSQLTAPFFKPIQEMPGPFGELEISDQHLVHEHPGSAYHFEALLFTDHEKEICIIIMTNNQKKGQLQRMKNELLRLLE